MAPLTLVTGGTRGIGAAVAQRLAAEGHDLVLAYRNDDVAAERTLAELRATGVEATAERVDLTRSEEIDALFAAIAVRGQLTGVVNNAGATYEFAALTATPIASIERTIAINLTAPLLVARCAVRAMSTEFGGPGGVIVNISSGAATIGSPGEYVHYAAAKAGLDTMTRGLGLEVAAQGIRVVGVAPGLIATDLHATTGDPERVERMAPQIPLGRAGAPSEIADAVAWLMSDQAGYVTATTLRVAGGR
ncbi:SDR family NAD(P)-dependent oxidoreductase [Nocardioides sp. Bht2]|uniref:SDR family NAD(P)-dependent oxidoreductase n=1 Tax=Nocardioides sp. Bht2 TaxID=3392297 RepID=UPI0039B5A396